MLRTDAPSRPASVEDLLDSRLLAQIGRLDVSSRRVFLGKLQGERRSKKRGQSVEFADHRPYVAGDDLRRIDWNIYGRLDRFFMKMFLEEEDLSVHVVLDASLSQDCGEPSKFLFAQRLAAALGYVGLVNLNRVAATALGGRIVTPGAEDERPVGEAQAEGPVMHTVRDLRGRRRLRDLSRFLCAIEPEGAARFDACCKRIALSRRGRGVMIVISDFMFKEGYEDGLRMLAGRGYDVFCVQVLSPQEVDPTGGASQRGGIAGDLRLRDVEDADFAEVTLSAPLLKRYRALLAAYNEQLRVFCARRDMSCVTVTSDTPVETVMLDYFRTRGLLR
jgi:uncharacterized protein (DUF58 family)